MKLEPGKTYSTLDLMGVVKTNRIYQEIELEVREQIAQEIEAEGPWCDNPYHRTNDFRSVNDCPCYKFAAAIARGKK